VEDLVALAYFGRSKTKKEARISAKNELAKRKILNKEIDIMRKEIRKRKSEERKLKLNTEGNGYGVFEFIFEIVFAFLHL